MSTTAKTEALYTALEQVLGIEQTETLMELLSKDDDTATRADLALLRSDVAEEFEKIDARFEKIDARFEDLNATFHSYARMFVVVHTTTVLAVAAMVLGVTQLM